MFHKYRRYETKTPPKAGSNRDTLSGPLLCGLFLFVVALLRSVLLGAIWRDSGAIRNAAIRRLLVFQLPCFVAFNARD